MYQPPQENNSNRVLNRRLQTKTKQIWYTSNLEQSDQL